MTFRRYSCNHCKRPFLLYWLFYRHIRRSNECWAASTFFGTTWPVIIKRMRKAYPPSPGSPDLVFSVQFVPNNGFGTIRMTESGDLTLEADLGN